MFFLFFFFCLNTPAIMNSRKHSLQARLVYMYFTDCMHVMYIALID